MWNRMSTSVQKGRLLQDTTSNFDYEQPDSNQSTLKLGCDERDNRKKSSSRRFQFLSIRAFVAFAGIVMCAQMALGIYGKSVLTSIEKRFGISSSVAGFIASSFNIGNLIFVVAVSKLSSTGHRPRIMAVGSLIVALGGFVNFTPHLINQPYQPFRNNSNILGQNNDLERSLPAYSYLYIALIFGEILQGVGATVLIPLSSSYIDDFASKSNSPLYLGILFVLQNIGPGFGYLIGSWTSNLFVDFDRVSTEEISVSSDNKELWIGAWWLGYIIISAWVFLSALPLFFFPKAMPKIHQSPSMNDEQESLSKEPSNFPSSKINYCKRNITQKFICFCKDFGQTVKRLMTNFSYMSVVFGYSGLMFVVGSITAFMPKFLEASFSKSSGSANLTFGLAVPPTTCLGLLVGGYVVKRFGWSQQGILKFIIASGVLALLPLFVTLFIKCDESHKKCALHNHSDIDLNMSNFTLDNHQSFQSCREAECQTASIFFVILTAICAMFSANMVTPIYTVILRSVEAADKCTAIGLMFLIIRGLAQWTVIIAGKRGFSLVPAPIVSGAVIDQTCIEWNVENEVRRNCLHYNENAFRIRYLLLSFFAILFAVILFSMAYVRTRIVMWRSREDGTQRKLISTLSKCFNQTKAEPQDNAATNDSSV